jgi:hypothetical protein
VDEQVFCKDAGLVAVCLTFGGAKLGTLEIRRRSGNGRSTYFVFKLMMSVREFSNWEKQYDSGTCSVPDARSLLKTHQWLTVVIGRARGNNGFWDGTQGFKHENSHASQYREETHREHSAE